MVTARHETTAEVLRASGTRLTRARQQVLDAIGSTTDHLTAEEILDRVRSNAADVHRATVYRSLETLASLGVIEHTHLGHGPAVYHLVRDHHTHLVCENCGSVTDVDAGLFDSLASRVRRDYGFVMDTGHFAIVGRCINCAGGAT